MLRWIILTLGGRCKKPADRYLFLPGSSHQPTVHLTCEHLEQPTVHLTPSTNPLCNLHLNILNNRPENTLKPTHIQYLCMNTLVHLHIVLGYPTSQYSRGIQGQENLSRHNLILCLNGDLSTLDCTLCTLTRNCSV